jgi:hypothetical protein
MGILPAALAVRLIIVGFVLLTGMYILWENLRELWT